MICSDLLQGLSGSHESPALESRVTAAAPAPLPARLRCLTAQVQTHQLLFTVPPPEIHCSSSDRGLG